jgi:capsular polysaccharide biosynthesis protein
VVDGSGRLLEDELSYIEREKMCRAGKYQPLGANAYAILQDCDFQEFDETTLLCHGRQNFYHWHFDHLWLIPLLREMLPADQWGKLRFAFKLPKLTAWQLASLDMLGVCRSRVLLLNSDQPCGRAFHFELLLLPQVWSGHYADAVRLLGNAARTALPLGTRSGGRRLYISRRDAPSRRVANEVQLLDCLEAYGFECVELSRLSYMQQLACFAEADIVIAPHGAGLTGFFAARPGTILMELFSRSYIHDYFSKLCIMNGGRYLYMISDSDDINGHGDYVVSVDALDRAMCTLLGTPVFAMKAL